MSLALPARARSLALFGLIAFALAWDLWAVTSDQRPTGSDTFTQSLLALATGTPEEGFVGWLQRKDPKGPVAALLALPLLYLLGDAELAARMLSLLAHGVLMLQVFLLARRCTRRFAAGLWAALLCATSPMVFGWCRLDYPEPVLAVFVLGSLQLMLSPRLDRAGPWLLMGLLAGLGLMVKLSLSIFLGAPALWVAVSHLRRHGWSGALRAGLALAVAVAVTLPWLLNNLSFILLYAQAAHKTDTGPLQLASRYLALPGVAPLLLMALVSLVALWWRQADLRRPVGLVGSSLLVSVVAFGFVVDYWSRYIMPSLAVGTVLAGCGLDWAMGRALRPRARRWFFGLAATLLLGQMGWLTLHGDTGHTLPREIRAGLITPDRRPYSGLPRALRWIERDGRPALLAYDSIHAVGRIEGRFMLWRHRGSAAPVIPARAFVRNGCGPGDRRLVLLISTTGDDDLRGLASDENWPVARVNEFPPAAHPVLSWLTRQRVLRELARWTDPDGLRYMVLEVGCDPPLPDPGRPARGRGAPR